MKKESTDLEDLNNKINNLKNKVLGGKSSKKINPNLNIVSNIILELFSGILIGGAIGYFLDKAFNTKFVFFIIFIFLGFIAGVLNLYKKVKDL